MREILFRAKEKKTGKWVYGSVVKISDFDYRIVEDDDIKWAYTSHGEYEGTMTEVESETISQYTGLTDKNGRKIWENDVCKYFNQEDKDGIAIIKYDYVSWVSGTISEKESLTPLFYLQCSDEWEVIGNVFDKPELLEGGI